MKNSLVPEPLVISDQLRAELPECFASPQDGALFRNPWEHPPLPGVAGVLRWKMGQNEVRPAAYRARPLPVPASGYDDFKHLKGETRIFWIGHASFLIELDGVRVAVDPIFGRAGGLVPRVTAPGASPEQMGALDAVLVTHGHHDHMDGASLKACAEASRGKCVFVVPRGLADILPSACRPVVELSWWEHVTINGVRIHLVPAQHWHRRGMFDTNRGLWGGYVVEGTHRVYHSGDTGYFRGFQAIGRAFGGIDAACLPLGAYEPKWFMATQHMSPEDSVRALLDMQATHFVGMHWGVFDLSDEPLSAGPERLAELLAEQSLDAARFHVMLPGGSVALSGARNQTRANTQYRYDGR